MTISSQTRKAGPYNGNGSTTSFPFTFKVFANTDVLVVRANSSGVETALTLGTDYTVSLNSNQDSNAGGNVVMGTAPASGYTITIASQVPLLQSTDFTNQGGFYPKVLNASLDKLTILTQQLQEEVDRSAKLPISNTADANTLTAAILQLANDQTNIDLVAGDLANIDAVAANETNIDTVAGINANITTVAGISANVTTVAGIASNVTSVAGNATNINAVAGNATNINAVVANETNIDAVAANETNIDAVAANETNINTTVANMAAIIDAPNQAAAAAASAAAATGAAIAMAIALG